MGPCVCLSGFLLEGYLDMKNLNLPIQCSLNPKITDVAHRANIYIHSPVSHVTAIYIWVHYIQLHGQGSGKLSLAWLNSPLGGQSGLLRFLPEIRKQNRHHIESQFEDQPDPCNIAKAKTRVTKTSLIFPVQKKNLLPIITSGESSDWRATKPLMIPRSPLGSGPFRHKACLTNFSSVPSGVPGDELWPSRSEI